MKTFYQRPRKQREIAGPPLAMRRGLKSKQTTKSIEEKLEARGSSIHEGTISSARTSDIFSLAFRTTLFVHLADFPWRCFKGSECMQKSRIFDFRCPSPGRKPRSFLGNGRPADLLPAHFPAALAIANCGTADLGCNGNANQSYDGEFAETRSTYSRCQPKPCVARPSCRGTTRANLSIVAPRRNTETTVVYKTHMLWNFLPCCCAAMNVCGLTSTAPAFILIKSSTSPQFYRCR